MNKIIIGIIALVLIVGGYLLSVKKENKDFEPIAAGTSQTTPAGNGADNPQGVNDPKKLETDPDADPDLENFYDEEIVPATDVFTNARDAYDKIMASIKSYDDIVLEQFAGLNEKNCSWCAELFSSLRDTMLKAQDDDTKSYLAELLAITGDQGNLEAIMTAYQAGSESDKEIYLESLELTAGDDDLVNFLNGKIEGADAELRESLIAAISNHGSLATVDTLYQRTIENGDPNGYYDYGMGLGELIPDAEALPKLAEIANKRDEYSHLAVKALLNYGDEGLRQVVDIISGSNDSEMNQKLLADAIDHVSFDENTAAYVNDLIANSTNPDIVKFAKEMKTEMDYEFEDDTADTEDGEDNGEK